MDIQFTVESSLTLTHYVIGYVIKAEKSNMQDVWQEVNSNSSIYSKLWSFGVRSLRSREWVSMKPVTSYLETTLLRNQ